MAIERREKLPAINAFFHLRVAYAAIVNAYECHVRRSMMAVNRLFLVFRDDGRGDCVLRNPRAEQEFPMRAGRRGSSSAMRWCICSGAPLCGAIERHKNVDVKVDSSPVP